MSELLFSLAYFSRNAIEGTPQQVHAHIEEILTSARRNNGKHGVTGALLFSDGCFAQVLEGARGDIEEIFETIQCDPRHKDVTIMHLHPIEQRGFGEWSMAFAGIEGVSNDPQLLADGMGTTDGILTTPAGKSLLAALHSVVRRDDVARREKIVAP
jgi:hypothetical protein